MSPKHNCYAPFANKNTMSYIYSPPLQGFVFSSSSLCRDENYFWQVTDFECNVLVQLLNSAALQVHTCQCQALYSTYNVFVGVHCSRLPGKWIVKKR